MLILEVLNVKQDETNHAKYSWWVKVNSEVIASGEVDGHYRPDGWRELIRKVLEADEQGGASDE